MSDALTEKQAFLVLNAIPGAGSVARNRLLGALGGDPSAVLKAGVRALREAGATEAAAAALGAWREHFDPAAEERRLARIGAYFISQKDGDYPKLLRELPDPPIGLYGAGRIDPARPCIAIVGTRRATPYGLGIARALGAGLARAGVCVVSGLARGIDAAAHEGALSASGATAAILGCGVDICYPPEHRDLTRRIAGAGALFSEFPLGRQPEPMAFAMRNRIISGMSSAVVVVESAPDGGAMITARFACEQGRTVFAVPGRIDQPLSSGCHQLIRDGATLLTGVDEIFEELSHLPGFNSRTGAAPGVDGGGGPPSGPRRSIGLPRPGPVEGRTAPRALLALEAGAGLEDRGHSVMACFADGASLGVDAVAAKTGLAPQQVCAALMALELKGFLARSIDGAYQLQTQS